MISPEYARKETEHFERKFLVFLLFCVHIALGLSTIPILSPTYDEPVHLYAGYACLKAGNYMVNGLAHAPLGQMWSAFALLPFHPTFFVTQAPGELATQDQYSFADTFLYRNRLDADFMLAAGRLMTLLLSLLLGMIVYQWSRALFGQLASLMSPFLWAFSSSILAQATLVTTDMAFVLCFFSFFFCWDRLEKNGMSELRLTKRYLGGVLASVSLGSAFASKYMAISIIPIELVLVSHKIRQKRGWRPLATIAWIALGGGFLSLLSCTGFGTCLFSVQGSVESYGRHKRADQPSSWAGTT